MVSFPGCSDLGFEGSSYELQGMGVIRILPRTLWRQNCPPVVLPNGCIHSRRGGAAPIPGFWGLWVMLFPAFS